MNAFVPYLAALHQQDLLEQAEFARRLKLAPTTNSVPAWRKRLSDVLASAARQVDPTVKVVRVEPLASGRGADLLPAC